MIYLERTDRKLPAITGEKRFKLKPHETKNVNFMATEAKSTHVEKLQKEKSSNVGGAEEPSYVSNNTESFADVRQNSKTTTSYLKNEPSHRPQHTNISLIVKLKGELGNHLSFLAGARITQLIAAQKYPYLNIQLVGQHQDDPRWVRGRDDLIRCFPEFRDLEFEGGDHDPDFLLVQKLQNAGLNKKQQRMLTNARESGHAFLQSMLDQQDQANAIAASPASNHSKYSLPFLIANSLDTWMDTLENEYYYNDIRRWMRFNESACRASKPRNNEIVVHHRNFMASLGKRAIGNSFTEVPPDTAANQLFHRDCWQSSRRIESFP